MRAKAIIEDTRLKEVSIGGTMATYAPSACGGRGLRRLRHITSLTVAQPWHGWGRQAAWPKPQAPERSPIGQGKATLLQRGRGMGLSSRISAVFIQRKSGV
jgi:hypothetical protein